MMKRYEYRTRLAAYYPDADGDVCLFSAVQSLAARIVAAFNHDEPRSTIKRRIIAILRAEGIELPGQPAPPEEDDERAAIQREAVTAYYDAVCRMAETTMIATGKLEGAHYAAMQRVREEWNNP
jgi:hypothetical protein